MQTGKSRCSPVVRISKGTFAPEQYDEVIRILEEAATPLIPAIGELQGLLYFHAGVDSTTNSVVNVSVWETEQSAKQMETLAAMLAQRPLLEAVGVQFQPIANYKPLWKIEGAWAFDEN